MTTSTSTESAGTSASNRVEDRAQRVLVGGQQLDGIARNILGDGEPVAVENITARRWQLDRSEPVTPCLEPKSIVLQHLGLEERAAEHHEGKQDDPPRTHRTARHFERRKGAHRSIRIASQSRKSITITTPTAAVVTPCSGAHTSASLSR